MHKYFTLLVTAAVSFFNVPSLAQDSLGYEVYDSVMIDLKSGVKADRYLPFDVPFYLYGSSNGIEAVHLQMIESSYQACCTNPHETTGDCTDGCCSCSCRSVTDQRLDFFKTVRDIKSGKDIEVNSMLMALHEKRSWIRISLNKIDDFARRVQKLNRPDEKDTALYHITSSVIETLVSNFRKSRTRLTTLDAETLKPYATDTIADFLAVNAVKKIISELTLNNILWDVKLTDSIKFLQQDSIKYIEFLARNFRHSPAVVNDNINSLRNLNKILTRVENKMRIDSIRYRQVREHWLKADLWKSYEIVMSKRIRTDSLSQCNDCNFNPMKCNTICSWKQDAVNSSGDQFFLQVPPLEPNHDYIFYFEVVRSTNGKERNVIKHRARKLIISKVDSLIDSHVRIMRNLNFSLDQMRRELLYNPYTSGVAVEFVTTVITTLIRDEYGADLTSLKINMSGVTDQYVLRALINQMISHKLYRQMMRDNYKLNDVTPYALSEIRVNSKKLIDHKINFFRENKMQEYHLLDTLNQLIQGSRPTETLRYSPFVLQNVTKNVPTGLIHYSNLQQVPLRDLDSVNDFEITTIQDYLTNLTRYETYLQRLQTFLIVDLIRSPNGLRRKLFSRGNSADMSNREIGDLDRGIRDSLIQLSLKLEQHQNDVIRFKNIYLNYKQNLEAIQIQIDLMLDSLLQRNRSVQIASARRSGGFSSANFHVRSQWSVTADVGLAYISLGSSGNQVTPYFGANFNFRSLNRQAYYGLFTPMSRRKKLKYQGGLTNEHRHCISDKKFLKASSLVLGLTTTDLSNSSGRENLIDAGNLNMLLGYGVRITDATRFSIGGIFVKQRNSNPAIEQSRLRVYPYVSLSIDVDVVEVLGQIGKLLNFRK
jgi:hypothetical protein